MTSERLLDLGPGAAGSDAHWGRLAASVTDLALLTLNAEGQITAWSEGARALLGYPAEEACALRIVDLIAGAQTGEAAWDLRIARLQGKLQREMELRRADGAVLRVEMLLAPLREGAPGFAGVARPLPPARRMERTLRRREEQLQRVLDLVHEGILILDAEGRIIHANDAARRLLDLDEPPVGLRFDEPTLAWVPVPDGAHGSGAFGFLRVRRTGEPVRAVPAVVERRDGQLTYLQIDADPLRPEDAPSTVLVALRDVSGEQAAVTERVRRERLEAEGRRLVEVEERERGRIARELHDEVGQSITLLLQHLESEALTGARLKETRSLARTLMAQVRGAVMDLRPSALGDLGLCAALLALLERFTASTSLAVEFQHSGLSEPIPDAVAAGAYRVVQEALTNAARHSGADHVTLRVRRDGSVLAVEISDNGRGFDAEALPEGGSSGMAGMRSRARLLAATFDLHSASGAGCRIRVEFSL
jgi:PAS domain S-box-containing protein